MTQSQYQRILGKNRSRHKGELLPVETIAWKDAIAFCKQLSELPAEQSAGRIYRLPTEAEWEFACRAGSTSKYSFGDSEADLGQYAWYDNNSSKQTHPVGQKLASPWGLYDMHGNVWEWCQDWYGVYGGAAATDPAGPDSALYRVFRGGSCEFDAKHFRSAVRLRNGLASSLVNVGFRVAFSVAEISTREPRTGGERDDSPQSKSPASTNGGAPPEEGIDINHDDAKMDFLRKNAPMVVMGESLDQLYKRHPDAKRGVLKRNPDGSQELQWGGGLASFQVLVNEDKVLVYHLRVLRISKETAERYAMEPREVFGEPLSTDLPKNDPKAVSCNRWRYNGYSLKTAVVMDRPIRGSAEYAYYSDLEVGNLDAIEAILGK